MNVVSRWYGVQFTAMLFGHLGDSLEDAGAYLEGAIKEDLRATIASSPFEHSKPPSEYPYFHMGDLHDSFGHETDRRALVTRVGSSSPVARYLEFGTSVVIWRGRRLPGLAPRPTIRRNLVDESYECAVRICRPF